MGHSRTVVPHPLYRGVAEELETSSPVHKDPEIPWCRSRMSRISGETIHLQRDLTAFFADIPSHRLADTQCYLALRSTSCTCPLASYPSSLVRNCFQILFDKTIGTTYIILATNGQTIVLLGVHTYDVPVCSHLYPHSRFYILSHVSTMLSTLRVHLATESSRRTPKQSPLFTCQLALLGNYVDIVVIFVVPVAPHPPPHLLRQIDSDEADACEEEDVAYNISATLDGSNTADSHAAAHTVSTTPISGAGRTLSSLPIKACAIVCSSSGSSGDDDTEATTEWTATFSRTSTTDAIPSWCGQRRRSGYLSPAGRFGGAVSRGGGVGWTRAVCAGSDTVRNTGSRMGNPSTVISPSFAAPVPLSVPDKSCFDDDKNKRGGFNTVSAPWPTMAPSATKNQSAFDAATAAGVIAAATETSAAFIGFGSVAGIAPCGTTASAPCPAAAGLYGGGKAAPGDRSHRHHDPGGGRVGGNRGDAVVALLNVNLDRLHLESAKPSTTRVV